MENEIERLAETAYSLIEASKAWRGNIKLAHPGEKLLEYFCHPNAKPLKEGDKDDPRRLFIFSLKIPDGVEFMDVARKIQKLILERQTLSFVPTIPHVYEVLQEQGNGANDPWWFSSQDEFEANLTRDPFNRWIWRRTGIPLSRNDGPAIKCLETGEAIWVVDGWETKKELLPETAIVGTLISRIDPSKPRHIPIEVDDQAPPVWIEDKPVQQELPPNYGTMDAGGIGTTNIKTNTPLFQLKDGQNNEVLVVQKDGTLVFNGKISGKIDNTYNGLPLPSNQPEEEAETSSGWAAPLACLVGAGILGVLATKAKVAQVATQPANQVA